jgi:hypothetical protein
MTISTDEKGGMLHMMVATHGPETCPASVPEVREKALPEFQKLDEVAKKLGVAVQGGWTNMPAHAIYIVVDAPNAHIANQMAMELHLMDWNTVTVQPVITLQEAIGTAQQR